MNLMRGTLSEVRDVWVLPSVRQRLGLALFSMGVGLIAGTGGLALIVADQDSDPRGVFAFAPEQTLAVATAAPKSDVEAPPAKITGAGQKNRWVSLSRKRASLLGKFPVSEPGRDTNEES